MSATAAKIDYDNYGITVIPQQLRIGAEIHGLDLRTSLTGALYEELKALLLRYKVLFFRDQDLSREQHIVFGSQFGDLDVHPIVQADEPLIQAISAERIKRAYRGSRDTRIVGIPTKRSDQFRRSLLSSAPSRCQRSAVTPCLPMQPRHMRVYQMR